MTWGLVKEKDCGKCANAGRCYVQNASYNLPNILTSVDRLIPPDANLKNFQSWECAGGTLKMDCNAYNEIAE